MEDYEAYVREVAGYKLQIITYKLGEKHVCIINNLDPGATICRMASYSREEALKKALQEANACIARSKAVEPTPQAVNQAQLDHLEYRGRDGIEVFTVDAFLSLDNNKRMEYILSGMLLFLTENGQTIPAQVAMRQLHKACMPATAA
ncbi:MAG: hypothetical protein ABUL49_00165 [bacterium]